MARLTDSDINRLVGHHEYNAMAVARVSQAESPLIRLGELIYQYLLAFSECKHGQKPSICATCHARPRNNPRRWNYDPNDSPEANQAMFDDYQAWRIKAGMQAAKADKLDKLALGYTGQAMLVNKRPIQARVRGVSVSKQGQVNYKELGPSRYNSVLEWGRKWCPPCGQYEKRLK